VTQKPQLGAKLTIPLEICPVNLLNRLVSGGH
jgi:hypothetical protein